MLQEFVFLLLLSSSLHFHQSKGFQLVIFVQLLIKSNTINTYSIRIECKSKRKKEKKTEIRIQIHLVFDKFM